MMKLLIENLMKIGYAIIIINWSYIYTYIFSMVKLPHNAKITFLQIQTDTWCSSGGLAPDGTLVNAGGWSDGYKALRLIRSCDTCDWQEFPVSFSAERW